MCMLQYHFKLNGKIIKPSVLKNFNFFPIKKKGLSI